MAYHADHMTQSLAGDGPAGRRDMLFRESAFDRLKRWTLGTAWSLAPKRIGGLPNLARLCFEEILSPDFALPDPARASERQPGLAGLVHELDVPTLMAAYRRGLYPLSHIAPLKWLSPPWRSVLDFNDIHISNNLRRLMRQKRYTVTFDRGIEAVLTGCAGRREGRWHLTWITPRMMHAYAEAFDAGHVHSFEVWNEAGELAAGGYGMSYGGGFTSESQFTREPNASRIGMTVLNWHLAQWGYRFNDGKLIGPLWQNMGFREIPRSEFLKRLPEAVRLPGKSGRWQVESDLETVSRWQPAKA